MKEFRHFALCFSTQQNNTTLSPGFLGQRFNNQQRAALLTSLVQYLVNSSWLWRIMRAVLTNQKRRNILNVIINIPVLGKKANNQNLESLTCGGRRRGEGGT